nr:lycopene cyclase domain-containing protein [Arthrobacter silviterrae]
MAGSILLFLVALRLKHIGLRSVLPPVASSLVVLLLLTAVFDNVMISSGLFDYGGQTLLGPRILLAPIEDFTYPVCAVFLAPALWWLAGGRPPARVGAKPPASTETRKES